MRLKNRSNYSMIILIIISMVSLIIHMPYKKIISYILYENNIKLSSDALEAFNYQPHKLGFANSSPDIYIYNTHDHEKYLDTGGVREAAYLIKDKLKEYNIETLVEDELVSPYRDSSDEYKISRKFIEKVVRTYPDIKLIIDLHRDALERDYTYVTIDGINYAKIMFVQGVKYENYQTNLNLANKISDMVKERYSGVSKGILLKDKDYQHPNYNQDLSLNAVLLELGSNNNTYDEVKNTIDILVPIIKEVIYAEKS